MLYYRHRKERTKTKANLKSKGEGSDEEVTKSQVAGQQMTNDN